MKAAYLTAAALAVCVSTALAQSQAPANLQVARSGAASYACGGVAADGRDSLRQLEGMSNARLVFATQGRGAYLADVPFAVTDTRTGETMMRATANGPICLLQLPPGRYRVEAIYNGAARQGSLSVGRGGITEVALRFPSESIEDIAATPEEKRQARE